MGEAPAKGRAATDRVVNSSTTSAHPAGQLNWLAERARRVMLRTSEGPLRPLWQLLYRMVARGVSTYLRAGHPGASIYAMGGLEGPDTVYGVSDVDLTVVIPAGGGPPGEARDAMTRRWEQMCRTVPPLRKLVFVAVYEDHELQRAIAGSPCLRSGRPASWSRPPGEALFRPGPFVDLANVASRPILEPASAWHLVAGRGRLPSTPEPDAYQRGMIAWLELQHWWRYAFGACVASGPSTAYLCVKLASEPARVWLWLVHGERVSNRREALQRGVEALPEESDVFERALALQSTLAQSPDPPLAETLEDLLRLTRRLARWLVAEAEAAGVQDVRLIWGEEDNLVLARCAGDPLRALLGTRLRLLPLVDWRTLVWPAAPDEALVDMPGSPADPATVGAAAVAGRAGPYPALRDNGLLVLPAQIHLRTLLRAVQCPLTDPISFAVLDGARVARFSRAPGWSIQDTARRAVAEHRAWLGAGGGTGEASEEALGLLFTAARAGLLLQSLESAEAELALTVAAVAERLGASGRVARSASESSYEAYLACRSDGGLPPTHILADLRKCVLELPAYRHTAATVASAA